MYSLTKVFLQTKGRRRTSGESPVLEKPQKVPFVVVQSLGSVWLFVTPPSPHGLYGPHRVLLSPSSIPLEPVVLPGLTAVARERF